ncbi:hypothetical protein ACFORO_38695 [Amycolatopsis halotolerans]|uniref:Uncharacterized protein n=1 Tax=Amycolatopsis halotolerans TaxID=330083 RepID=A0ABV7QS65_9PSEU
MLLALLSALAGIERSRVDRAVASAVFRPVKRVVDGEQQRAELAGSGGKAPAPMEAVSPAMVTVEAAGAFQFPFSDLVPPSRDDGEDAGRGGKTFR